MLAARFGFPGPAIPFGSPTQPVCTLFAAATSVPGAVLPDPRFSIFTSSFGRLGCVVGKSTLATSNTGLRSIGFASTVRTLGVSGFKTIKMCGCVGFNFTGTSSGTTGFGSSSTRFGFGGGTLTLAFIFGGFGGGGGGGYGATVIFVA